MYPGIPSQANLSLCLLAILIHSHFGFAPCGSFWQCFQRVLAATLSRCCREREGIFCLLVLSFCFLLPRGLQVYVLIQQSSNSKKGVWQSCCPLLSRASKQGSLWKVLCVHCGFTATMSTSTILVHLTTWPLRSIHRINLNIVLNILGW